jgi:hypothetical protein
MERGETGPLWGNEVQVRQQIPNSLYRALNLDHCRRGHRRPARSQCVSCCLTTSPRGGGTSFFVNETVLPLGTWQIANKRCDYRPVEYPRPACPRLYVSLKRSGHCLLRGVTRLVPPGLEVIDFSNTDNWLYCLINRQYQCADYGKGVLCGDASISLLLRVFI